MMTGFFGAHAVKVQLSRNTPLAPAQATQHIRSNARPHKGHVLVGLQPLLGIHAVAQGLSHHGLLIEQALARDRLWLGQRLHDAWRRFECNDRAHLRAKLDVGGRMRGWLKRRDVGTGTMLAPSTLELMHGAHALAANPLVRLNLLFHNPPRCAMDTTVSRPTTR